MIVPWSWKLSHETKYIGSGLPSTYENLRRTKLVFEMRNPLIRRLLGLAGWCSPKKKDLSSSQTKCDWWDEAWKIYEEVVLMKASKQGHLGNCLLLWLHPRKLGSLHSEGHSWWLLLCLHTGEGYTGGAKSLEKIHSELFHGRIKA